MTDESAAESVSQLDRRIDDVCHRALDEWGIDAQLSMPMEEMGELTAAISQYQRGRIGEREVAEEIADVRVCLRQLEMMVGPSLCREELESVVDDLDERLPESNMVTDGGQAGGFNDRKEWNHYVCSECGNTQRRYGYDQADYCRCPECEEKTWHHRPRVVTDGGRPDGQSGSGNAHPDDTVRLEYDREDPLTGQQTVGRRVKIGEIADDGRIVLCRDPSGWEGIRIEDGECYYVNESTSGGEVYRNGLTREEVEQKIQSHIDDPILGGPGVFKRGATPP